MNSLFLMLGFNIFLASCFLATAAHAKPDAVSANNVALANTRNGTATTLMQMSEKECTESNKSDFEKAKRNYELANNAYQENCSNFPSTSNPQNIQSIKDACKAGRATHESRFKDMTMKSCGS